MKKFTQLALIAGFLLSPPKAHSVELLGLVSYNLSQVPTPPSNYESKENSIGYGFLGRLDLGPGRIETGFLYAKAAISTHESFGVATVNGSYWILPLLYRYTFFEPFFSIAAGFDYALVGSRSFLVGGAPIAGSSGNSGFRGHWGVQFSFEAQQDLGENLSAVFDARYRRGLADAIAFGGSGTKYHFWMLALGIQKRFDP